MAWRIHQHVVSGIIDNREKGQITGSLWLVGREEPIQLKLIGNASGDIAGRLVWFINTNPLPGNLQGFCSLQEGRCGDFTVYRDLSLPAKTIDIGTAGESKAVIPYFEWFSLRNGRVVIEGVGYTVTCSAPSWQWRPEEAEAQVPSAVRAAQTWVDNMEGAAAGAEIALPLPDPFLEDQTASEGVDQLWRINEQQANKIAPGSMICGGTENLPPEIEEGFWQNVLDFENATYIQIGELLERDGFRPPHLQEIPSAEIESRLWALIHALARHEIYLDSTDHLSDRDLYALLMRRVLNAQTIARTVNSGWRQHFSISEYGEPGDEDGSRTYLRFYADDETRLRWARDFPDEEMPPHQDPPFDRDWRLPQEKE